MLVAILFRKRAISSNWTFLAIRIAYATGMISIRYREPSGQWTFGPPWDFDLTAGISRGDTTTSDLYIAETIMYYSDFTSSELMMNLMAQSWFVNRVKQRYLAISEAIALVVQSFALIQIHHEDAFIRHSNRWSWFSAWEKEHDQVIEWLLERNQWLYHWAQG